MARSARVAAVIVAASLDCSVDHDGCVERALELRDNDVVPQHSALGRQLAVPRGRPVRRGTAAA